MTIVDPRDVANSNEESFVTESKLLFVMRLGTGVCISRSVIIGTDRLGGISAAGLTESSVIARKNSSAAFWREIIELWLKSLNLWYFFYYY
jgi:hypothetical protein